MKSPRFRTAAERRAFTRGQVDALEDVELDDIQRLRYIGKLQKGQAVLAAAACADGPSASTLGMAIKRMRSESKTLAAVRAAVIDSAQSANAIAVSAGLNRQTVHEILVNGTGDQTLAKYEAILAAIGKRLVVIAAKK